jgi:hypothetical protein
VIDIQDSCSLSAVTPSQTVNQSIISQVNPPDFDFFPGNDWMLELEPSRTTPMIADVKPTCSARNTSWKKCSRTKKK